MKKIAILFFVICMLCAVGCNEHEDATCDDTSAPEDVKALSECLTEENGKQFLVLPRSKTKLLVHDSTKRYLDSIDLDLLKTAEEKMLGQLSQYTEEPFWDLEYYDGALCLYAEVIVDLKPSTADQGGCGIDHEHKIFREKITKK